MSLVQDRDLLIKALLIGLWQCLDREPLVWHPGRGRQLTSEDRRRSLAGRNLLGSTSAVGYYADNAATEGSFVMIKHAHIHHQRSLTLAAA